MPLNCDNMSVSKFYKSGKGRHDRWKYSGWAFSRRAIYNSNCIHVGDSAQELRPNASRAWSQIAQERNGTVTDPTLTELAGTELRRSCVRSSTWLAQD